MFAMIDDGLYFLLGVFLCLETFVIEEHLRSVLRVLMELHSLFFCLVFILACFWETFCR
jgi:hypothetical protein